jgi:hypothetical protein
MPNPKKKGPKRQARNKKMVRIDLIVEAQKAIVTRVGGFVEDAAEMVTKGEFSPAKWLQSSAKMWKTLADDLSRVTNKL